MKYKFTINGNLPNLNDYLKAERIRVGGRNSFHTKGNLMKHEQQTRIIGCIRRDLKSLKITKPIRIHYDFYEPNEKRDLDNIMSTTMKFTQDSLVLAKVISNDGWKCITGISAHFYVDKLNPRIEVTLIEVTEKG